MSRMVVFIMKGKDLTGLSKEDLVICFSCAKLECSVSCGKGLKFRDVHCFNSFQAKIEEGNCRHLKKPRTYKICRAGRCPAWKANRWKECSVSCGVGIQQREVYCQLKGLGQVSEEMCNHGTRPTSKRHCLLPACMQYQWLADEWEACSASYRRKEIYRKVKCVDENQLQVDESFCDPATKPPSTKNCRIAPSKYIVLTGELSQCSASCAFGYQQRITYCIGIHSVQNQQAHGLRTVTYRECPVEPSPYIHKCNIKGCSQAATWRVGKWTKCSVSCGVGVKERTVECMTENGLSSDLCLPRLKPDARKICHEEECEIFTTCKGIQIKKGIRKDGEYLLNIKGRMIKIYCSGMDLENPKEYLTLVKGEADNFSEVYGFRLQNPYECPFNGSRRQDCACRNDYLAAGFTVFSKIRFDVTSMQIKTTDFLFAQTILGRAVPFATAGDCYSAARCPQGQFSINLAGTGLRLSSTVRWIAQGNYATADIHESHDGTKIYGRCGGFCGKCIPNTMTGLQLQI
ncbi:PREDICTED: A disintegrin and metalloproteinase with thrombospondin motifs 20-like, partial [Chlamydotis macqueenii]|uniref:A disintegrin and metalloproteinase with thrombospondin motifs 20-like n=1 Tax=Chlamydotis macqueenii TaxID=187382 RepID=UPI0005297F39